MNYEKLNRMSEVLLFPSQDNFVFFHLNFKMFNNNRETFEIAVHTRQTVHVECALQPIRIRRVSVNEPVNDLPCVGEICNDLDLNEHLLADIYHADHLVQIETRVGEKLFHLQIALKLVELLHLGGSKPHG